MKCTCGQHELNGVAALSCGDGVIHRPVAPCYHLEQSMTTPRTDAFARAGAYMKDGDYTSTQGKQFVHIDDARQLEQELNEVKDALDEVLDEIIDNADGAPDATGVGAFCTGLIRQHNALMMGDRLSARQERDQLRKVVDSVCDETQSMINYCNGDIMYSVTDIRFLKARCLENIKRIEQLPHVIEQRKSK